MGIAVCPMCHVANNDSNRECRDCGYEFGQSIETLRGLLRSQLRRNALAFVLLLLLDAGLFASIAFVPIPALGIGAALASSAYGTYRAWTKIAISRHSLRLLDEKEAALPKARAVSK